MSTNEPRIYVGTSGWNYRHWRGTVYPPGLKPANWLHYLSRELDSLEINSTFYRIPSEDSLQNWQSNCPPSFRFALKMWRGITHYRKLANCREFLERYFHIVDQFEPQHQGPLLVQLPSGQAKDLEKLERFLEELRDSSAHRWQVAVEFRHDSWLAADVYRMLDKQGAAICLHDMTGSGAASEPNDTPFVYVRRHGPAEGKYNGSYSSGMLEQVERCGQRWVREGKTVFIYFNNDLGGHAFHNAKELMSVLAT